MTERPARRAPWVTKAAADTLASLTALGAKPLAEALLDLAGRSDDAARLVARLTSNEDEIIRRYKAELAKLKQRRRFISWAESSSYAARLAGLLEDLEAGVTDACSGVELVAAFYRSDARLFDACDDSNGSLGDVFRIDARDLFARYAAACPDKQWIVGIVADLVVDNDYGVRDSVLQVATQYLPEESLHSLADRLWHAAETAPIYPGLQRAIKHKVGSTIFLYVQEVARQLTDPVLFERAQRAWNPELGTAACAKIAEVWLAAGDPAKALEWISRVPTEERFLSHERDDLLRAIHEQLGNHEEVERLAWKRFREGRSLSGLDELLHVIGANQREAVIASEARLIMSAESFRVSDAAFLVECELVSEAERYVVDRQAQLNGNDWSNLRPLAAALRRLERPWSATVLYRALLDAILDRGYSPAYRHAAKYLVQLDQLAAEITDWGGTASHAEYIAGLKARHSRKSSFWAHYQR